MARQKLSKLNNAPAGRKTAQPSADFGGVQVRSFWRAYRCKACGRLQFRGILPYGSRVQVKCWHGSCRRMNVYKVTEQGLEFAESADES